MHKPFIFRYTCFYNNPVVVYLLIYQYFQRDCFDFRVKAPIIINSASDKKKFCSASNEFT